MKSQFDESENWVPSQGDYLAGLSRQLRATHRLRSFQLKAMYVLLMITGVGLGVLVACRQSLFDDSQALACSDIQRHMQAYVQGTLAPPLKLRFEDHLKTCPRCQEVLSKLQASNAPERVHLNFIAVQKDRNVWSRGQLLAENR